MTKQALVLLSLAVIAALLVLSLAVPALAGRPSFAMLLPFPQGCDLSPGYTVGVGCGAAYIGCGGEIAPPANADYEQQIVELVNAERAAQGLPPLKRVAPLDEAARYQATDMGQDHYCDHASHDRLDSQLVYVCSWDRRVGTYYAGWLCLAENIYCGGASPQSVMEDWMNSSKHRSNILHTHMWEIGVGYYEGSGDYRRYWVQDFGRRSGVYPLVINQDAATTVSPRVSLYAYGDWEMIRLRNNNADWSDWQAFRNTLTWTLSGESGEQTVWAEMRGGGQTVISSDSIYLAASTPTPSPTPAWTPTVTPTSTPTHTSTPTSTPTPTVTPTATPVGPWLNWARPHAPLFATPGGWAAEVIYGNVAVPAAFTATLTGAAVFVDGSQLLADTVTTVHGAYGLMFYSPGGAVAGDTFEVDIALSDLTLSGAGVVPWRCYLPLTWKELWKLPYGRGGA